MGKRPFLGEFEQLVLLAVMRLEGSAYGMSVRNEIAERTGRDAVIGAVYAALSRLERKGMVRSEVGEPEPVRGGRARRTYRVTPAGRTELARSSEMLRRMSEGLEIEYP